MNSKEALKGVYLPLYRRAPNRDVDGFQRHIIEFEKDRDHRKTLEEAAEIFRILQVKSHAAIAGGRRAEAYIVHDPETGYWHGVDIPSVRESFGLEVTGKRAEKSKGSIRSLVQHITVRSRDAFIDEIQRILGCDRVTAEKKFTTARNNQSVIPPIVYHEPTDTWRGHLAPVPTLDETAHTRPRPEKQRRHWELFSSMPWLNHDQRNLEASEAVAWVTEKAGVDRTQSAKLIHRAFGCSRDKAQIPLQFRVVGDIKQISGKEYIEPYILTDEDRDKLVNMAAVAESSFEWRLRTTLKIKESQVTEVSGLVFSEGLLVRDSVSFTKTDTGEKCTVIGGKNWIDENLANRRAQLEAKKQKEAQESEVLAKAAVKASTSAPHGWPEELNDTEVGAALIFKNIGVVKSLDLFTARVTEFTERYGSIGKTPEEVVSHFVKNGSIVEARGNLDGRFQKVGYRLAA